MDMYDCKNMSAAIKQWSNYSCVTTTNSFGTLIPVESVNIPYAVLPRDKDTAVIPDQSCDDCSVGLTLRQQYRSVQEG